MFNVHGPWLLTCHASPHFLFRGLAQIFEVFDRADYQAGEKQCLQMYIATDKFSSFPLNTFTVIWLVYDKVYAHHVQPPLTKLMMVHSGDHQLCVCI